jgi:hypothetical protein
MQFNSNKKYTAVCWQAGQAEQISEQTIKLQDTDTEHKTTGVATHHSVQTDIFLAHSHFSVMHYTS